MRRVARILLNVMAGISLLLFLSSAVLWVRGYFVADNFYWHSFEDVGDRSYWMQNQVSSGRGGIGMHRLIQSHGRDPADGPGFSQFRAMRSPFYARDSARYPHFNLGVGDAPVLGGFKYGAFSYPDEDSTKTRPRAHGWQLVVPFWAMVPLLALLPAVRTFRWLGLRSRSKEGCCQSCGYDLRATPDRCPECGAVSNAPSSAGTG